MKKIVLLTAFLLASCGQVGSSATEEQRANVPVATPVGMMNGKMASNTVVKFCDQGRAIYTIDDDNSSAIGIVENAKECKR